MGGGSHPGIGWVSQIPFRSRSIILLTGARIWHKTFSSGRSATSTPWHTSPGTQTQNQIHQEKLPNNYVFFREVSLASQFLHHPKLHDAQSNAEEQHLRTRAIKRGQKCSSSNQESPWAVEGEGQKTLFLFYQLRSESEVGLQFRQQN